MPIVSDRTPVITLAKELAVKQPSLTKQEAARLALRQHFGLADSDGIWGGSEAAVCMEFQCRSPDEDLFLEIAKDVAESL